MRSRLMVLFAAVVLVLCTGFGPACCSDLESVAQKFEEAYMAVNAVAESHGDVGALVDELNSLLTALETGSEEPGVIEGRLDNVIVSARVEQARAVEANNRAMIFAGAQALTAVLLSLATWRYFPGLYWRTWLRVMGGWRIRFEK